MFIQNGVIEIIVGVNVIRSVSYNEVFLIKLKRIYVTNAEKNIIII